MFFIPALTDGFYQQVSRSLLSILTDLNNPEVWMVSTRPLNPKSSSPCINPLMTVLRAPITIGISVLFMFLSFFFSSLARSAYILAFRFFSVLLCGQLEQQCPLFSKFFFFLLIITRSGRLVNIRISVCISKSLWISYIPFSRTNSGLNMYHLFTQI